MRVTEGATSRSLAATARRAQIIEATIAVIAEVGYAQTTYSRIAQHAGLLREDTLQTDDADSEASPAERLVLVPRFAESVQLPGRHGRGESPGRPRDPELIAGARERDEIRRSSGQDPRRPELWPGIVGQGRRLRRHRERRSLSFRRSDA